MPDNDAPTVVKLGGSHAFSGHLKDWIGALGNCGGRAVIVPGGGPFADAVRAAQPKIGFDDKAAHHMALLAMEQYGCALSSLDRRLAPAQSLAAIRHALRAGRVPVWLPTRMTLAAEDIPASWDVTSDSLAVWLASRIGARRVILVKQIDLVTAAIAASDLVVRAVVDKAFPEFLARSGATASVAGPGDSAAVAAAIASGAPAGTPIE